jgi:beta-N-acetylhexosaminidase
VKPRIVICCLVLLGAILAVPGCGDPSAGGATGTVPATTPGDPSGTASPGTPITALSTTSVPTTASTTTSTTLAPAARILQGMTLRQKAAQVLLLAFDGTTVLPSTSGLLADGPPGGFLLLSNNVTGAAQLLSLTAALQEEAAAAGSQVGLFIAVDQEGGPVRRIREGVTSVPAARTLGDTSSPAEAGGLAAVTAEELLALGVNMNLAPVADVVSDPDSFLYRRSYGGDPALVAGFAAAVTQAFVDNGIIAVVKHFPGHGSAPGDSHSGAVVSTAGEAEFRTVHLPPFAASIEAGAECVMVGHIVATAYDSDAPASRSARVIEGLLRTELGFAGVVVADDLEMEAAGSDSETYPGGTAVAALSAGCDLLISAGPLARQQVLLDAIVDAVGTERLSQERLDEAVLRILALKLRHGIASPVARRP